MHYTYTGTPDLFAGLSAAMIARGLPSGIIDVYRRRYASATEGNAPAPCPFCFFAGLSSRLVTDERGSDVFLVCSNCQVEILAHRGI